MCISGIVVTMIPQLHIWDFPYVFIIYHINITSIIEYMFIIVFVHTLHCAAPHYIALNMYYIYTYIYIYIVYMYIVYMYIVYMYIVYIDYCPLWIIGMHIQVVLLPSLDFLQWQWWTGQALVTGADRSLIQTEVNCQRCMASQQEMNEM